MLMLTQFEKETLKRHLKSDLYREFKHVYSNREIDISFDKSLNVLLDGDIPTIKASHITHGCKCRAIGNHIINMDRLICEYGDFLNPRYKKVWFDGFGMPLEMYQYEKERFEKLISNVQKAEENNNLKEYNRAKKELKSRYEYFMQMYYKGH